MDYSFIDDVPPVSRFDSYFDGSFWIFYDDIDDFLDDRIIFFSDEG